MSDFFIYEITCQPGYFDGISAKKKKLELQFVEYLTVRNVEVGWNFKAMSLLHK